MASPWKIKGEVVLSCNCEVFCPCVISLGRGRPSHGACHTWWGLNIHKGHAGGEKLDGLKAAVLMDIPGPLAEGQWSVALYLDERASPAAADALSQILSGQAGGSTSWFSIMTSNFLGTRKVPISFESEGKGWKLKIPKIIDGHVEPIEGPGGDGRTTVTNTAYWMSPDVVVCKGTKSRFRDWGRNWDLTGRSGEYARVEWSGP
jgi:hypothetical protein